MTNEDNRCSKRLVLCMGCSHEFLSHTRWPRCSECGSSKVLNVKEIQEKYDILKLRADVNKYMNAKEVEVQEYKDHSEMLKRGYNYLKDETDRLAKEVEQLKLALAVK